MTLASAIDRNDYTGNGSTSSYSYTFRVTSTDELLVCTAATTGTESTLTLITDYTVVNTASGGTVSLVAGPLTSGNLLTIKRNLDATQETALANQRQFFGSSVEAGLDRLAMVSQMLMGNSLRSLRIAETEDGSDFTLKLPVAALRASRVIGFDASGNVEMLSTVALGMGGFGSMRIPFATAAGLLSDSSRLTYDSTNDALTLGNASVRFHSTGDGTSLYIGQDGGNFTTTGTLNTGVGYRTLKANTSGFSNTAFGYGALEHNTTAYNCVAIGSGALQANVNGQENVAVGYVAMTANIDGHDNTALGNGALFANTSGDENVAVGLECMFKQTTVDGNTAVGFQALHENTTTAAGCDAFGWKSLYSNAGSFNSAFGNGSLSNNVGGTKNSAFGYQACNGGTSGGNNSAFGYKALFTNSTGTNHCAFGYEAAMVATGDHLTAFGADALGAALGASNTTGIGSNALFGVTTGHNNTALGYIAGGTLTTGDKCTLLGTNSDTSANNLTLAVAIGYSAIVGASSTMVLGGTGANVVSVAIGKTTASARLHVVEATVGSEVLRFESIATNDDPADQFFHGRLETTAATATTINTIAIATNTTYMMEAHVRARRTGGASGTADDAAAYVVRACYKTATGTVTLIGAVNADYTAESQAAWDCTFVISGSNVLLQVTGAAANTVTWHSTIRVMKVST